MRVKNKQEVFAIKKKKRKNDERQNLKVLCPPALGAVISLDT